MIQTHLALLLLACASPAPATPPALAIASSAPARERLTVTADDGHALALWAEVPAAPRGAILLLHGRTWSGVPDFDLEGRSTMDALAAEGFAAYALDLRGYGGTARDATGWNTPDRAARDLVAALDVVASRHPELGRPAVLGWSLGSLVAHLAVQRDPAVASAVVLYAYPRDPDDPIDVDPTPATAPPKRAPNTARAAASDFITPGSIPAEVVDQYVAACLAADPVRADWRAWHELDLDPAKLVTPTLVLHGEHDPAAPTEAMARLFSRLGADDRAWVVLPDSDHAAHLEAAGPAFVHAVVAFLERPIAK